MFGCGNKNNGLFSNKEDGILGLGYDKAEKFSIIGQTKGTFHGKFSYCIPEDKHGFLRLGHESNSEQAEKEAMEVSWEGIFYKLTLKRIDISFEKTTCIANYDVIVDSGTTFTRLPKRLFNEFSMKYGRAMKSKSYKKVKNCKKPDILEKFGECYEITKEPIEVPDITFQFDSTSVVLPSKGITVQKDSIACLAFLKLEESVKPEMVIWGSYQQKGIEINFDVGDGKMWFNKLDDCNPKILGGNNVPL